MCSLKFPALYHVVLLDLSVRLEIFLLERGHAAYVLVQVSINTYVFKIGDVITRFRIHQGGRPHHGGPLRRGGLSSVGDDLPRGWDGQAAGPARAGQAELFPAGHVRNRPDGLPGGLADPAPVHPKRQGICVTDRLTGMQGCAVRALAVPERDRSVHVFGLGGIRN